jgi:hypothetical protein
MSADNVVFISGATGPFAAAINGLYDGSSDSSGGYALLRKRGDGSMLMEHRDGEWQVKAVSSKGSAGCFAYVAGDCAPAACASRRWKVGSGGKGFVDAPGVKMVTGVEAARKVNDGFLRAHEHAPLPPLPLVRCDGFCAGH